MASVSAVQAEETANGCAYDSFADCAESGPGGGVVKRLHTTLTGRRPHRSTLSPPRSPPQLELCNMLRVGQLSALWNVAHETNLTFNLVCAPPPIALLPPRQVNARAGAPRACTSPLLKRAPLPAPLTARCQVTVVACVSMLLAAMLSFFLLQTRPVFLVDYSVYRPPDSWKWPRQYHEACTANCRVRRRWCLHLVLFASRLGLPSRRAAPPATP
jgi:hypothetical protein